MKREWKGALIGGIIGFGLSLIFVVFSNSFGFYFLNWIAQIGVILCGANECIPLIVTSYFFVYILLGTILGYLFGRLSKL